MKRHLAPEIALAILVFPFGLASASAAEGWFFQPSYFSHNPSSGVRVAQYAPDEKAYARDDGTYLQSGYRHNTSRLRGPNGSSDNLHVVETWGEGDRIRPYGEWLRPFREGATPYGPWGNPQGPWTTPFESWNNPYGLGQIPYNINYRFQSDQGNWGPGGYGPNGHGSSPGPGPGGGDPDQGHGGHPGQDPGGQGHGGHGGGGH